MVSKSVEGDFIMNNTVHPVFLLPVQNLTLKTRSRLSAYRSLGLNICVALALLKPD